MLDTSQDAMDFSAEESTQTAIYPLVTQSSLQSLDPSTPSALLSRSPETPASVQIKDNNSFTLSTSANNGGPDDGLFVLSPHQSQLCSDPLKENYLNRLESYSARKPQRSSKSTTPKPHQVNPQVPWRDEVLPGTARKTKIFKGYVTNYAQARQVDEAWRRSHMQGGAGKTSNPCTDNTFPNLTADGVDHQYLKLCSQIFYSMCDWRRICEWTQVVTPQQREELQNEIHEKRLANGKHGSRGMTAEQLRPSDEKLAGLIPDTDEQHLRLMGIPFPDDHVVEQMATSILVSNPPPLLSPVQALANMHFSQDAAIDAQQGKLNTQPWSTADQG